MMLSPAGSSLPMPPPAQILPPIEFQGGKAGPVPRRNSEPGKGKASTRAKSGCWTCRIRRKKCDEMKTPEGFCQTCVRLRLECLGWGSRRPDWMREKNNVIERREKIKEFLANNGMIKGHAGSISRTPADALPDILRLGFSGNSPPRHPDLKNGHHHLQHHQHQQGVMGHDPSGLPPMMDHDRRRNAGNALLDFAYVASDPQQYGHIHHHYQQQQQMAAAHHAAAMRHHHGLDGHGPMLPPLSVPLPSPALENAMRTHHLPPLPDNPGNVIQVDPALQYLSDFGPGPNHNQNDAGSSSSSSTQSTSTAAAAADGSARPVVSLPTPTTWTNPFTEPSSFGRLYSQPIDDYEEANSPEVAASTDLTIATSTSSAMVPAGAVVYLDQESGMTMPAFTHTPLRYLGEMPNAGFVFHYLKEVLPVQYLLADQTSIRQWTYNLAQTSESTRSALCLLAALHKHCMSQMSIQGPPGSTTELDVFYSNTRNTLRGAKTITEGDAMASLHVISSFLFAGGRGPWHEYLDIASRWVESVLQDPRHPTPRHALRNASESSRFIIRATFWFDTLAAISQLRTPHFLHIYRELFATGGAMIVTEGEDPDVSMMDVMGCSAMGFLSLAEIAALAHWKEEQHGQGKLSVPRLVERGVDIETRFLRLTNFEPGDTGFIGAQGNDPDLLLTPDGVEFRRRLVSNVFRASAKIYLHTVISGGFPETPEIAAGVAETIGYLKKVPGYSDASRVVVRSVVFSVCIAGCMALESQQGFFIEQLQALGQEAEVLGNCSQAKKLMQRVWAKRKQSGGGEVLWREAMFEAGPGILLLA